MKLTKTYEELLKENEELRWQLEDASDTIHAIRTGQVDAIIVKEKDGHELYSLRTADQTYRVFIEKMNEGALTLNHDGLILYCNSMFAVIVGVPISNVIGHAFSSFVPDFYRDDFHILFESGWEKDIKIEIYIQGKDKLVPCQLSVTTLLLDEGPALSVILTDLSYQKEVQELLKANNTRLRETNEALEKSNNDLQQFASVASHDLQEPLRKMIIFSNMLRARLGNEIDRDAELYLDKVFTSADRMKRLISDILSYTRIGAEQPQYVATNLEDIMHEVIDDFEILIEEKKAVIEVGKLPAIYASRGQIRQLFQNLLSNSLKFSATDHTPRICIESEPTADGYCVLTFTDNGIGFDPRYSDKIFSLFQRLNTKDQYEGSGIGLSVAKKIVEAHGGSISVSSKEGAGTIFRVTLPCHELP